MKSFLTVISIALCLAYTTSNMTLGQAWALSSDESLANSPEEPLKIKAEISPQEWSGSQIGTLTLTFDLPKEYHAYEDQLRLRMTSPGGFKVATPKTHGSVEFYDKFSKRMRKGMVDGSVMEVAIEAPPILPIGRRVLKFELTYQACTEKTCLFPVIKTIDVPVVFPPSHLKDNSGSLAESLQEAKHAAPIANFFSGNFDLGTWLEGSMLVTVLLIFLAGVLTSFTPCIFPMIPITIAVLSGREDEKSRVKRLVFVFVYILGIATTYSALGFAAASTGKLFGSLSGNPWILSITCALILIMALSMFGLFEIQTPLYLQNKLGIGKGKASLGGAFVTGLLAGIIASPCVGPVLVTLLGYVASKANPALGVALLFVYAFGLGSIFLVLSFFDNLVRKLPRSGPWMNFMKGLLGLALLWVFYYYLNVLVPERIWEFCLGVGFIALASWWGAFEPIKSGGSTRTRLLAIKKSLLLAGFLVGFVYIANSIFQFRPNPNMVVHTIDESTGEAAQAEIVWVPYSETAVAKALQSGKVVIVDFFAEWCAACHELSKITFKNPQVLNELNGVVLFKYDATKSSAELTALQTKYKIFGLPTVLFFDTNGELRPDLTLTEFETPQKFLTRLRKVTAKK